MLWDAVGCFCGPFLFGRIGVYGLAGLNFDDLNAETKLFIDCVGIAVGASFIGLLGVSIINHG